MAVEIPAQVRFPRLQSVNVGQESVDAGLAITSPTSAILAAALDTLEEVHLEYFLIGSVEEMKDAEVSPLRRPRTHFPCPHISSEQGQDRLAVGRGRPWAQTGRRRCAPRHARCPPPFWPHSHSCLALVRSRRNQGPSAAFSPTCRQLSSASCSSSSTTSKSRQHHGRRTSRSLSPRDCRVARTPLYAV